MYRLLVLPDSRILGKMFPTVMHNGVLATSYYFQILDTIIVFNVVDMVDNFTRLKSSAEVDFHYVSMLFSKFTVYINAPIARGREIATFIRRVIFSHPKSFLRLRISPQLNPVCPQEIINTPLGASKPLSETRGAVMDPFLIELADFFLSDNVKSGIKMTFHIPYYNKTLVRRQA